MPKQKKESILKAAELLFSSRGFTETKVSDISKESGIHEASIYSYFNNKRNLLFAVYGRYIEDAVKNLNQHFRGMKEPGPMLRKTIWHYLDDIINNPHYARILMEAQRDPGFFSSKYDRYLKEFSAMVLDVIVAGQKEGFFRRDISSRIIRNMAMGACVITGFDHVVFNRGYDANEMSDIIYQLVINGTGNVVSPYFQTNDGIKRSERIKYRKMQIIDTALQIFSMKGFSNSTISDIAGQANLGEATLYEYFDNKEAILLAISEAFMKDLSSWEDPSIKASTKSERNLRMLIWKWVWQLYSHKDFSRLLVLDLLRNINYYSSPGYKHLEAFQQEILKTVEQGGREGIFISGFSPLTYFHMIIGTFDQFLLGQTLMNRPPLGLAELGDIVDTLVRAIKIPKTP